MKKPKIFLTAALIITVVTGALALNAHRDGSGSLFCGSTPSTCSTEANFSTGGSQSLYCGNSLSVCQDQKTLTPGIQEVE